MYSLGFLNNFLPFKAVLGLFRPLKELHPSQVIPDVIIPSVFRSSYWSSYVWLPFIYFKLRKTNVTMQRTTGLDNC